MSVQMQIDRITDTVSGQTALIREIRTALEEKGGSGENGTEGTGTPMENNTVKLQGILQTVRDLPEVTEVKLQEKSVTPGITDQSVLPDAGYEGLSEVTVLGDSDLLPGNIKNGVRIFGVDGSYEGAELNFEVVGGTSAPASPKENTIWVNTNTAITDWVFSATQPSAKSGRVWISTGTSSPIEFNALKKNGIQVYPISAKQYVSSAWVDVTAKSYQNGEWAEWVTYLYRSGDQCVSITGGWGTDGYSYGSHGIKAGTLGTSSMSLSRIGSYAIYLLGTTNPIDFTDKTTLVVEVTEVTKIQAYPNLSISRTKTKPADDFVAQKQIAATGLVSIDISDIDSGYVSITCNGGDGTLTVKNIWLS